MDLCDLGADGGLVRVVHAVLAEAEDLQAVVEGLEAALVADGVLEGLQVGPVEFEDLVAAQADQVIMMLILMGRFVVGVAGTQAALANQSALHQEVEGPVHRGPADIATQVLQFRVELLGIEVRVFAEDGREDLHPFAR